MALRFEKKAKGVYLLDVKGYVCPHPQIYTKKALQKLQQGEILEVLFDNPSSGESIATMCDHTDDEIIKKVQDGGQFVWDIQKA